MSVRVFLLLAVLALLAFSAQVHGAAPQLINYQGRLKDSGGHPVTSPMNVTFRIWDAAVSGDPLWTESQAVAPDSSGLFSVLLGSLSPIPDSIFADTSRWVGINLETMAEMSPRVRLVSVPYAFRVATVDRAIWGLFLRL
ncbi:MAG: hypothetical protein NT028_15425 [candidate division Zixibacteria bacterium]|nr:hypothetical protein [candidate division Zixibacteria bacterium]